MRSLPALALGPFSFLVLTLLLVHCAGPLAPQSKAASDLPNLMVKRLSWMDQVAHYKQAHGQPVNDPKREASLIAAMEQRGAGLGLPKTAVKGFFDGQMQAAKVRQEEWLRGHPKSGTKDEAVPDLKKTIRPALDDISAKMLAGLADARKSGLKAEIVAEAQRSLAAAGYSKAVSQPAVAGLQAGLK